LENEYNQLLNYTTTLRKNKKILSNNNKLLLEQKETREMEIIKIVNEMYQEHRNVIFGLKNNLKQKLNQKFENKKKKYKVIEPYSIYNTK